MLRKYKYYCRLCERVTLWIISRPRLGVETHTCYICKTKWYSYNKTKGEVT